MTRKLTPARLDEIEAAAKKATPSEWAHDEDGEVLGSNGESLFFGDAAGYGLPISRAIAEHVAMMDPATTLALVAEVRELRAKVERVREIIGPRELLDPHQGGCEGLADETLLSILDALGGEA